MASTAYLRDKYLSSGPAKKKKKKKHKEGGLKVVDVDDDGWAPLKLGDDADDDDAPQVVYEEEKKTKAAPQKKGQWKPVEPPLKPRVDSDDDLSPPRRARVDSDDDLSPPRKPRVDSDDDLSPPRKPRVDSDDDLSPPRKPRVDSDDDLSPPRKPRADDVPKHAEVTKSGHRAGLMTKAAFRETEAKLRKEVPATESKQATVYRDRGRKLDMAEEYVRAEAEAEAKRQDAKKEFDWGKGSKQKRDEDIAREELAAMKDEPFARTRDDPKLDQFLRDTIHADDPMKDWTQRRATDQQRGPTKRVYKGPTPPSNRFGIAPGYRWDGVDRGNGWEAKRLSVQAKHANRKHNPSIWSGADM